MFYTSVEEGRLDNTIFRNGITIQIENLAKKYFDLTVIIKFLTINIHNLNIEKFHLYNYTLKKRSFLKSLLSILKFIEIDKKEEITENLRF